MATNAAGEFERALERIEEIVKALENGTVNLDESVKLYKEGRDLTRRCEELLKSAQAAVDAAGSESARAGTSPPAAPETLPF